MKFFLKTKKKGNTTSVKFIQGKKVECIEAVGDKNLHTFGGDYLSYIYNLALLTSTKLLNINVTMYHIVEMFDLYGRSIRHDQTVNTN